MQRNNAKTNRRQGSDKGGSFGGFGMKEEMDGERVIIKFTRYEIFQMGLGRIFRGHKVDIGLEVKEWV